MTEHTIYQKGLAEQLSGKQKELAEEKAQYLAKMQVKEKFKSLLTQTSKFSRKFSGDSGNVWRAKHMYEMFEKVLNKRLADREDPADT